METSKIRQAVVLEILEMDKLNDEKETEKRMKFIQKILENVLDYEIYLSEYDFNLEIKALEKRGVKFSLIKNSDEMKKKWDEIFTKDISSDKKEEIYFNSFKWHIFSYKVLKSLKNNEANIALLNSKKTDVYIFFENSSECYKIDNFHLLKEYDIINGKIKEHISDFYIFDITEKWTYISTHEENCGPYFYQIK